MTFNFEDLFIFDLANNHQGDLNHAENIISKVSKICFDAKVNGCIKFQFRDLDHFIHKDHLQNSKNKHIPRFLSTKLPLEDFRVLKKRIVDGGLLTCCTPFDEKSVENIVSMNFDILKVASCSAQDWPLLEEVARANLPVIFSTGGQNLNNIDDLVSFFEHRGVDFAIMHCVSMYPTPLKNCNLDMIDTLKNRYGSKVIGWSTHEDPREILPLQVAYSKGARIFERHIGMTKKNVNLNKYSSEPKQVEKWIEAYLRVKEVCGKKEKDIQENEAVSIEELERGIYAKRNLKKGNLLSLDDVYFAMPRTNSQLKSGLFSDQLKLREDIKIDKPINVNSVVFKKKNDVQIIKNLIHEIKAMLNSANIILDSSFEVEYSHHDGIKNFKKTGATIINCINREYCKKIIIQTPNQKHPAHYHKRKEETFQILSGELEVYIDGKKRILNPGDTCLIQPGVWHSFQTTKGCIFEEISTTHFNNDSFYKDKKINSMKRENRKTIVNHWGRFELFDKISS